MKILLAYKCHDLGRMEFYSRFTPLGLGFIGALLRRHGHDARIVNASAWSWRHTARVLEQERPDILGVSVFTFNRHEAMRLAALARAANPGGLVIAGGPHATHLAHHLLEHYPLERPVPPRRGRARGHGGSGPLRRHPRASGGGGPGSPASSRRGPRDRGGRHGLAVRVHHHLARLPRGLHLLLLPRVLGKGAPLPIGGQHHRRGPAPARAARRRLRLDPGRHVHGQQEEGDRLLPWPH